MLEVWRRGLDGRCLVGQNPDLDRADRSVPRAGVLLSREFSLERVTGIETALSARERPRPLPCRW